MNENSDNISKLLKHFDSTQSSFDEIDEMLLKINSLKQERIDKTKRNTETQENLKSLQDKKSSLQNLMEEIHSSENYKKYVDLQNKLNDFIKQKSKIKSEIDSQFTKISRPLGRYAYASSLDKDQNRVLSALVDNPIDALIPENLDSIVLILENIRKAVSSGSISVKDTQKTLTQLTETEESLDGFMQKVSEYSAVFDSMQQEVENLKPENLTSTENELSKTNDFENDANKKSKTILSEIDEIESQIPALISNIENKLQIFSSTRYTISKS